MIDQITEKYWNFPPEKILERLKTNISGLSLNEARRRLGFFGENRLKTNQSSWGLPGCLSLFSSFSWVSSAAT